MNEQDKKKVMEAVKGAVDKEIDGLKMSVINQLEERGKFILNESLEVWASKVSSAAFPDEMAQVRQKEQTEFNEAAILAKSQMGERLKELIGEFRAIWKKKEVGLLSKSR